MAIPRTSLDIPLTPELQRLIAARAASGHHQTAGEAVRAALRSPERSGAREDGPAQRGAPLHLERT